MLFPAAGAALSAAGALVSDLVAEYAATFPTTTVEFAYEGVNRALRDLRDRCEAFLTSIAESHDGTAVVEYLAEARYQHQVWELELPLRGESFSGPADVDALIADFHELHREVFEISDPASSVEILALRARASYRLAAAQQRATGLAIAAGADASGSGPADRRMTYFASVGPVEVPVWELESLSPDDELAGPAIIDARLMTIVVPPGAVARGAGEGGVLVDPWGDGRSDALSAPRERARHSGEVDRRRPLGRAREPLRGDLPVDDEHAGAHRPLGRAEHRAGLLVRDLHRRRRALGRGREPARARAHGKSDDPVDGRAAP